MSDSASYTVFDGQVRLTQGTLQSAALSAKSAVDRSVVGPVHIYDDRTGGIIDLDLRGTESEVLARLPRDLAHSDPEPARGRGRPKLGVVAREVTLLPRHWQWLGTQPGGASVALRKLVDEARRTHAPQDRLRAAHEAAYRFMSAMAGDLAQFEEATRALFANDAQRFDALVAAWPEDVRTYARQLAFPAQPPA
jgi:hypothetical protein